MKRLQKAAGQSTCWNEVVPKALQQNLAIKKTQLQGGKKQVQLLEVVVAKHWVMRTVSGNTETTQTQAGGSSVTELGRMVLDTHRLRRDFHQKLGFWGSDERHYKLQLINVYHTNMKENRKDGGYWRGRGEMHHNQSCLKIFFSSS